jgi:hypothetical protein
LIDWKPFGKLIKDPRYCKPYLENHICEPHAKNIGNGIQNLIVEKECNNHKHDYDDHPIRNDFVGCKKNLP